MKVWCIMSCLSRSGPKKVKNIKRTSLGDKVGRIHMKPQHLDKMGGRRVTALRGGRNKRDSTEDSSKKEGGAAAGERSSLKRKAEDGPATTKEKKRKARVAFSD